MNGNDAVIFSAIIAFIFTSEGSVLSYFLSTNKSEKDAQRDYDYTAKKELYANYEPLVFQFHQLCESANVRITDLAENLRPGEVKDREEKEKGLIKYATNTAYRIFAPFAIFKLMEQRLTISMIYRLTTMSIVVTF